jgi:endonuclease I
MRHAVCPAVVELRPLPSRHQGRLLGTISQDDDDDLPSGDDDDTAGDDDDDDTGQTLPCEEVDEDGDGVDSCDDCDDALSTTFPGAPERCDQLDNDCDGEPLPEEYLQDCAACDAAGFWLTTLGLQGESLVEALHDLTAAQDCSDYSAATTFMFVELDIDNGEVECVYTGRRTPIVGGEKPDQTDMNTEHSWPQSLGAEYEPAKCDIHHLYPTDSDTNNMRANYPFAEVVSVDTETEGGSLFGEDASGNTAFEPRDVHKGNVARSMLYFAMRYGHDLSGAEVALYQDWSEQDPVDEQELERTVRIGEEQGAQNPYVACPWMAGEL